MWIGSRNVTLANTSRGRHARGWYVSTNYVVERLREMNVFHLTNGVSTTASQQWDAAAVFFDEPVARGGAIGYLLSDADSNEWLANSMVKELMGYPLSGGLNDGRLHYVRPGKYEFSNEAGRVYSTKGFLSYPGNSGGPLCVQVPFTDRDVFFPAAVYLGTTGGRSLVRAIDSDVASLINRAASSAALGTNFTGGGVIAFNAGGGLNPFQLVRLTVRLAPAEAVAAGARWRLQGATNQLTNGAVLFEPPASYRLEFLPASGFTAPPPRDIVLAAGQDTTLEAVYVPLVTAPAVLNGVTATAGGNFRCLVNGPSGGRYLIQASTDLQGWTPVVTNTVPFVFEVPLAADKNAHFFRAVAAP